MIPGVPATAASVGTFTGITWRERARCYRVRLRQSAVIRQLLGNFEYRIPDSWQARWGWLLLLDIGTSFNLRSNGDQFFNSNFLDDQPFLSSVRSFVPRAGGFVFASLSALAACTANTDLALCLASSAVIRDWCCVIIVWLRPRNSTTRGIRPGLIQPPDCRLVSQQVFLRGQAQTNTAVRLSQSIFSKFGDYRTSLGMEVRVQVPVINVPFRLIFAYNPKARISTRLSMEFRSSLMRKRRLVRFSVGRTF